MTFFKDLAATDAGDWPLESFCDQLSQDLFSSCWETRHGAATAIREIISIHGSGAGKATYLSAKQVIIFIFNFFILNFHSKNFSVNNFHYVLEDEQEF